MSIWKRADTNMDAVRLNTDNGEFGRVYDIKINAFDRFEDFDGQIMNRLVREDPKFSEIADAILATLNEKKTS